MACWSDPRIYATPGLILRDSGSVGMFLLMWIIGAFVSALGMAVYVEFGTASALLCISLTYDWRASQGLPRSGGEKNYLEYLYRKPIFFATCFFAMYCCLLVRHAFSLIRVWLINSFRDGPPRIRLFLANVCISPLFCRVVLMPRFCVRHDTGLWRPSVTLEYASHWICLRHERHISACLPA